MESRNTNNKFGIPDKVADYCAKEYTKAYLYCSLFVQAYQNATDTLLEYNAFSRDLIGKDRELQRAFDRFDEAMRRKFGINCHEALKDFDMYSDLFNRLFSGEYKTRINGKEIDFINSKNKK